MSNGKTPQTEAQTLELLNASITRETVRGAVENFLGASKEAAKQDLAFPVRANICRVCGATRADGGSLSGEHARECSLRGRSMLTEPLPAVASEPPKFYAHDGSTSRDMNLAGTQDALLLDSGEVDSAAFWQRIANRATEMLDTRSAQLRTKEEALNAALDSITALKAREEMHRPSLTLALEGMKQQSDRADVMEVELARAMMERDEASKRSNIFEQALRLARNDWKQLAKTARMNADVTDDLMGEGLSHALAESRRAIDARHDAVSDAGPANDVALKVTE